MGITLTDNAADRVRNFLEQRGKGLGLRLGVKTTGCSGMAYVMEYVDELEEGDQVFEDKGVKIIINPKSLVYLDGTELDFTKEGSVIPTKKIVVVVVKVSVSNPPFYRV